MEKIYEDMTKEINEDVIVACNRKIIKLYPCDGKNINDKLNKQCIQRNSVVYAGHDLPVWRNNPEQAKIRIMVITQDPRRNEVEMTNNGMLPTSNVIGISTPFGLHSQRYRSHKTRGLVHYLFNRLQEELKNNCNSEELSIYYTDIYKFRGVAPKDVKDTPNMDIYVKVLRCEIEAYRPNVILLMGNDAQNAWDVISKNLKTNIQPLRTPHPSPNANGKWKEEYRGISSFTADVKINLILKRLKECLKI